MKIKTKTFGKLENLFFGAIPQNLIELSEKLLPTATAAQWHDYVEAEIKKLGYFTKREVVVWLDKGYGRIDIVAEAEGNEIAIELDYRTPRKKSIKKVLQYKSGMVLLRDPKIIEKENNNNLKNWTI